MNKLELYVTETRRFENGAEYVEKITLHAPDYIDTGYFNVTLPGGVFKMSYKQMEDLMIWGAELFKNRKSPPLIGFHYDDMGTELPYDV